MNFMVQEKVSIVSSKPQTTRRRIQGILTVEGEGQIIFVDAPGLIEAKKGLNAFLEKEAHEVIQSSDALLGFLNIDEEKKENIETVLKLLRESRKPYAFLIAKIDQTEFFYRKDKVREMLRPEEKAFEMGHIHQSRSKQELDIILQKNLNETLTKEAFTKEILEMLPESKALLFDGDDFTTENTRDLVSEFVREQCLHHLHQEIPFQMAVQVHKFDEEALPVPRIDINLIVAKDGHKRIVVGKGGEMIKKIGSDARKEIEKLMGQKIFMSLNVVVKEGWDENSNMMKELKYVLPN